MQRDDIAPFEEKRRRRKERKTGAFELRQDAELVRLPETDAPAPGRDPEDADG